MLTDFAEKYKVFHQDEAQAAFYKSDEPVSIYTAVLYFNVKGTIEHRSYAVVSDTRKSMAVEAQIFNSGIIRDFRSKGFLVDKCYLWTDGAGQHFKNRTAFSLLSNFTEINSCEAEWHYAETYHGKGLHARIGAVVKASVRRAVIQRKAIVTNASTFY